MNTKIKLIAFALAVTALAGCEKREVFGERRLTVKVVEVHLSSKSNSTVDLLDVKTNYLYRRERLSCSRSYAYNVKVDSLWDVTEMTYVYPESKRYSVDLVGTQAICTLSN